MAKAKAASLKMFRWKKMFYSKDSKADVYAKPEQTTIQVIKKNLDEKLPKYGVLRTARK